MARRRARARERAGEVACRQNDRSGAFAVPADPTGPARQHEPVRRRRHGSAFRRRRRARRRVGGRSTARPRRGRAPGIRGPDRRVAGIRDTSSSGSGRSRCRPDDGAVAFVARPKGRAHFQPDGPKDAGKPQEVVRVPGHDFEPRRPVVVVVVVVGFTARRLRQLEIANRLVPRPASPREHVSAPRPATRRRPTPRRATRRRPTTAPTRTRSAPHRNRRSRRRENRESCLSRARAGERSPLRRPGRYS